MKINYKAISSLNLDGTRTCNACGKSYTVKGIGTHYWRTHGEGVGWTDNNDFSKGRTAWNKGLSKVTDVRVANNAASLSDSFRDKVEKGEFVASVMSKEGRSNVSKNMSENNPGGKAKWFVVNGIKVQGTWERDVALMMLKENIEWSRPKPIPYDKNGNLKHYTPDFYLNEMDIYIEVKGYWWGDDKAKMALIETQYPSMKIVYIEKQEFKKLKSGELMLQDLLN